MELKRINQIQVGDVIGIYAYDYMWGKSITNENQLQDDSCIGIAYNAGFTIFKYVEVVSINKCDQMSWDGSRVCGKRYEFLCSDGKTYSAGHGATKYPVNEGKP
jgi:translation elongation factor EF-1alpha